MVGAIFGVHASQSCRWVDQFLPILEGALRRKNILPKRQLQSQAEFHEAFPEVAALFMDGTERPTQRAADYEIQKEHYSGKKNRHTKKNLVINDERQRVLILTKTRPGKDHDYTLFKQSELGNHLPEDKPVSVDSGFQGIEGDYSQLDIIIPFKKPKGKELSPLKKLFNRAVARGRVLSENTIAGIKRLKSVTDIYRNRRLNREDQLMLVACGLWNLHVEISEKSVT